MAPCWRTGSHDQVDIDFGRAAYKMAIDLFFPRSVLSFQLKYPTDLDPIARVSS